MRGAPGVKNTGERWKGRTSGERLEQILRVSQSPEERK